MPSTRATGFGTQELSISVSGGNPIAQAAAGTATWTLVPSGGAAPYTFSAGALTKPAGAANVVVDGTTSSPDIVTDQDGVYWFPMTITDADGRSLIIPLVARLSASGTQQPQGATGTGLTHKVLRDWDFKAYTGTKVDFVANGAGTEVLDGSVMELVGGNNLTIITRDNDDCSTWELDNGGAGIEYVVTSGYPRADWDVRPHLDDADVCEVVYIWSIASIGTGDGFRLDAMSNTTGAFTAGDVLREVNYSGTIWRDRIGYWNGSAHVMSGYATAKTGAPTAARIGLVVDDVAVQGRSDADSVLVPNRMSLTKRNFTRSAGVLASTSASRLWSGNMWHRVIVIYGQGITCNLERIIVFGGS